MDWLYVGVTVAFFIASEALLGVCQRLMGGGQDRGGAGAGEKERMV